MRILGLLDPAATELRALLPPTHQFSRNVINWLSSACLGHLEMVDMDMSLLEEDKQLHEDVALPLLPPCQHLDHRCYRTPTVDHT